MLAYPNIDPVAIRIGPLNIHWYGLMYLLGFAAAWWLAMRRARRPDSAIPPDRVGDLIFYCALGVIIGGRLGYVLFYGLSSYLAAPLEVFKIYKGGMSFHGGLLGVIVAMWLFGRHLHRPFFAVSDFVAPLVPIGLAAGRIGNFINGELWGRVTDVPWGMVFPGGGAEPRHPSQLYEAAFEGVVLFAVLWWFSARPRPLMAVSGLFLVGYGVARFTMEFFREPDRAIGFIAGGWLTLGQLLTLPMLLGGAILLVWGHRNRPNRSAAGAAGVSQQAHREPGA